MFSSRCRILKFIQVKFLLLLKCLISCISLYTSVRSFLEFSSKEKFPTLSGGTFVEFSRLSSATSFWHTFTSCFRSFSFFLSSSCVAVALEDGRKTLVFQRCTLCRREFFSLRGVTDKTVGSVDLFSFCPCLLSRDRSLFFSLRICFSFSAFLSLHFLWEMVFLILFSLSLASFVSTKVTSSGEKFCPALCKGRRKPPVLKQISYFKSKEL